MALAAVKVGKVTGPAALVDGIRKAAGGFNPSVARKEYGDNRELWQQYLDLMELNALNIRGMVDRHGQEGDAAAEPVDKFAIRQKMAIVINLVPSIVGMMVGYLFAEEPQLDGGDDEDIKAFLANADGQGRSFAEWVRLSGLPLALVLGWVDVLVQNPLTSTDEEFVRGGETDGGPTIYAITPLQRINWSTRADGAYNWICFKDWAGEDANPFRRNVANVEAYITVSAAQPTIGGAEQPGFWVRSWKGPELPPNPDAVATMVPAVSPPMVWNHIAGYTPNERCSVATLYYRQSIDPRKRHEGVSKVAMIAILTRAILNVLSWTQEDMLANLALFAIPSKGGKRPVDENNAPINPALNPFSIMWFDPVEGGAPSVVQGEVDHIRIKMEFCAAMVNEILRVASLLSVSGGDGQAKQAKSGVAGLVERNELFQELSQVAGGLDGFAYEVFALVKSWATGEDWTAERVRAETEAKANFHKGPYTLDPLKDVIENAKAVLGMFGRISPTMSKAALNYVSRAFLYANDPDLPEVRKEIEQFGTEDEFTRAAADPNKVPGQDVSVPRESELESVGAGE